MAVFSVSAGGIPNDPESSPSAKAAGGDAGTFKAPGAWAPWTQPQPAPQPQVALTTGGPGNGPGVPQAGPQAPGTSNHTSPLAQTLISGPGGSPVNPGNFSPAVQKAVADNQKYVQTYQKNQQQAHSKLLDTLQQLTGMISGTNPYSGVTTTATLTGQ